MRAWLISLSLLSGAAMMCLELVGSRLLAPGYGSSIEVWGSLLGVVLAALALGNRLGGALADRCPNVGVLTWVLALCAVTVSVPALATREVLSMVGAGVSDPRWGALTAACLLLGPGSLALGLVTPIAVRLLARRLEGVGAASGAISGASSVGGIFGALGTAFVLVPAWPTSSILFGLGLGLSVVAVVNAALARSARAVALAVGVSALLFAVQIGWTPDEAAGSRSSAQRSQVQSFPGAPVWSGRSRYHALEVWDLPSPDPGVEVKRWMMLDGILQGAVSVNGGVVDHRKTPVHNRMIHGLDLLFAMRATVGRVLFVGLGAGSAPGRMAAQYDELVLEAIEIDPVVVEVAARWFGLDRRRVQVHVGDGRAWLVSREGRWDAVVLDAYHGETIPFHLMTVEYIREVRDHLSAGGIAVANIVGAMSGDDDALLRATVRTWREVFRGTGHCASQMSAPVLEWRGRENPPPHRPLACPPPPQETSAEL